MRSSDMTKDISEFGKDGFSTIGEQPIAPAQQEQYAFCSHRRSVFQHDMYALACSAFRHSDYTICACTIETFSTER